MDTSTRESQYVRTEFASYEDAVAASLGVPRALRMDMRAQVWFQPLPPRMPPPAERLEEQGTIVWWRRFRVGDGVRGICLVGRMGEAEVGPDGD